ncbi:MAG: hypothetical protein AAB542_03815 [Patescibacteria group bacterium]
MTILKERKQLEKLGVHFKIIRLDRSVGFGLIPDVEDELKHSAIADADGLLRNPKHSRKEKPIVSDGTRIHIFPGERTILLDFDITGTCDIEGVPPGNIPGIQRVRRDTARILAHTLNSPIEASIPFAGTEVFEP